LNPEQLAAHIKRLTETLSRQQLITLASVFIAVVGVLVGTAYWINAPTFAVLFSDMDPESASSVVARLKTDKVDYRLDEGGQTVRVPTAKLDELRLAFSSQGMPASGRIGFEIFDRTAFGTTEFLEHVNYRRALEGELGRTISTIGEVSSARVHIAMAKDSLFAAEKEPAKASVVLKLRGRKPLAPQTIAAITGLVAASVEDLRPESVVLLDTFGRSLTSRPDVDDQEASGLSLDKQHRLERDLSTKVVALLEPIVGEGHVRVNVAARLNGESAEQTEERWDPTTVLRSKQTSSDIGAVPGTSSAVGLGGGSAVGAGARANMPPPVPAPGAPAVIATPVAALSPGSPASRTVEAATYEVSRVTRHTISPSGQVARLSVAVLVDDNRTVAAEAGGEAPKPKPRNPEEIERIHKLVAAAVGFEEDRGDQLTVENISFEEGEPVEPDAPTTVMQRVTSVVQSDGAFEAGRMLGVLMLAVMAFLLFLRPVMNRALLPNTTISLPAAAAPATAPALVPAGLPPTAAAAGLPTVAALEQQVEAAAFPEEQRLTTLTRSITKLAEDEPEAVARLVRTWISDNE
jgi:flagellar M-ring protein FliF